MSLLQLGGAKGLQEQRWQQQLIGARGRTMPSCLLPMQSLSTNMGQKQGQVKGSVLGETGRETLRVRALDHTNTPSLVGTDARKVETIAHSAPTSPIPVTPTRNTDHMTETKITPHTHIRIIHQTQKHCSVLCPMPSFPLPKSWAVMLNPTSCLFVGLPLAVVHNQHHQRCSKNLDRDRHGRQVRPLC